MMRTFPIGLTLALLAGCGTGASLAFKETPTPSPTATRTRLIQRTPVVETPFPINTYGGSLCIEIRPGQSPVVCPTPTPTAPTT